MILEMLHIIIGLAFALFIPGFLLVKIIFDKLEVLETVALAIAFSIAIDIFLGLFLGANKVMKEITGGITELNVWFYLIVIILILTALYVFKIKKALFWKD